MTLSSADSEEDLTLQGAADRLGVHYMTAYRYVRLGLLPAHKAGGTWRVTVADLDEFASPSQQPIHKGEAPWSQRLEARMVSGDTNGAWAVVEAALTSGLGPSRVYTQVLAPAMTSIGERWAAGELDIDDEHIASSIAARLIGRLGSKFNRRGRPKGTVVAAAPSGERHGLGLAMVTDILRGEGYGVLDLGPDTPAGSLVAAMEKVDDVAAVVMSVVYTDALPELKEMIDAVRDAHGAIPIIVGGRAITSAEQANELGADGWSSDPAEAAGLVERSIRSPESS